MQHEEERNSLSHSLSLSLSVFVCVCVCVCVFVYQSQVNTTIVFKTIDQGWMFTGTADFIWVKVCNG